jgi:hypothetical protein
MKILEPFKSFKTLAESSTRLLRAPKPLYPLLSISAALLDPNLIAGGIGARIYAILDFA